MYQPASYLIRFSSSRHCWNHLLLRNTLVLNIRHETTEWQIVHRWHCALGQEPLSQHFGQLWTPAISPFLVSFSKPKHFHLVRNKLFPTMCLVWQSEEQQRFGGCSKSSTSGGRNLYARYRLAQSLACARPAWQRTWQRRFAPLHAPRQWFCKSSILDPTKQEVELTVESEVPKYARLTGWLDRQTARNKKDICWSIWT